MTQIHKQFRSEQVKVLLNAYEAGHLSRNEIERTLGIGKTWFFALLKQYRQDPQGFSLHYQCNSPIIYPSRPCQKRFTFELFLTGKNGWSMIAANLTVD